MEAQLCTVCSVLCTQSCGKCKNVFYCSKEHQTSHWKEHKKNCYPFKIVTHPDKGRVLIATKDMAQFSVIIQEQSIIDLPSDKRDGERMDGMICVSCCKVSENLESCSKCSSPVCGRDCALAKIHAEYECKVLSFKEEAHDRDRLTLTSVIRCLLLKTLDREKYDALMTLQSNKEGFYKDEKAVERISSVSSTVALLLEPIGDFNQEEIATVLGIIDTKALMTTVTDDFRRLSVAQFLKRTGLHTGIDISTVLETTEHNLLMRATIDELERMAIDKITKRRSSMHLYAKTSIASHSCVPNATPIIQNSGRVKLITIRPIEAGEEITIAYTDLCNGTVERQKRLRSYYYFSCQCIRCQDPTELGTNFSSVKCRQCPDGYLLPKLRWDSKQDLETEELWTCNDCSNKTTDAQIQELIESLQNELRKIQFKGCKELNSVAKGSKGMKTVANMEAVIDKYSGDILHPNHYHLFTTEDVFTLTTNMILTLGEFSPQEIQQLKKISVAKGRKILKICDKLFLGNEIKGQALYLLWKAMQDDAYKQMMETIMSRSRPQEQRRVIPDFVKEHMAVAEEAVQILSLEPDVFIYQVWVKELRGFIAKFQPYFKN